MPPPLRIGLVAALAGLLTFSCTAAAAPANWAAPQIRAVTQLGVLGSSPVGFDPDAPLTQSALEQAVSAVDAIQHSASAPATSAEPTILSNVAPGSIVAGVMYLEFQVPGRAVDHVSLAVDGTSFVTLPEAPYELDLDTRQLADGVHRLTTSVSFQGGGSAISNWTVTVANASGLQQSTTLSPVPLPVTKSSLPASGRTLFHAVSPEQSVSIKKLDAALVAYLGLGRAAREIQLTLQRAGLRPPANTGTETIARLLALRLNHPAAQDNFELLPGQAATRAEAAYSFAHLLRIGSSAIAAAQKAADSFTLPTLTSWQQQILTTAVHYVGYPYVWGGTSPTVETPSGVTAPGGFDCSGFVWRVYKLTSYPDEGGLAGVLRGRTTYQMSGEVGSAKRLAATALEPADVLFFGSHGPRSKPSEVDHAAIYLGNGFIVQSSSEGVTLTQFQGWYSDRFAWARRPLHEAGLE
jgi:cell wall-associated NlpC family hydrolase